MNAASSTIAAARAAPMISGARPAAASLPSISARIRQSSPPVSVMSPGGSSRPCSGSFDSCELRRARATTAPMPIGMLTKKIQRHESHDGEHPAGERADRDRGADRRAPEAERGAALACRGTPARAARAPSRTSYAPPIPWTPRAMIRNSGVVRDAAGRRGDREEDDPDEEDAACGRRGRRATPAVSTQRRERRARRRRRPTAARRTTRRAPARSPAAPRSRS